MKEFIKRFITGTIIGSTFWYIFFYFPPIAFSVLLLGILCTILLFEWKNLFNLNDFAFWFIMPWYPILPFALMIYMNSDPCYRQLVYYMFVIVFGFDSSAYIAGKILGYHKIIPSISPGKTVEGFIGGFVGAYIVFWLATTNNKIYLRHDFMAILVIIVCCLAFVGDIFESFLKRKANIKDSGDILPGHGGFLDRFDAVIMAAFFFFLFRQALVQFLCVTSV